MDCIERVLSASDGHSFDATPNALEMRTSVCKDPISRDGIDRAHDT